MNEQYMLYNCTNNGNFLIEDMAKIQLDWSANCSYILALTKAILVTTKQYLKKYWC